MFFCATSWRWRNFRGNVLRFFVNPQSCMLGGRHRCFRIRCMFPHFWLWSICRRNRFLLNRRNRFTHRMFHCRWHCFRRNSLCVFMNPRSWILRRGRWRFRIRRIYSRFGLLGVCRRNRLLPDWRSHFAHRSAYLWLTLWRMARSRRRRWIFFRCRSRMLGLRTFVLGNRFCPGFRFRFRFRQFVDSFFCQMAGFLHGMIGGVCDFAALIAIFWLPILCCFAQLLPKLLKGRIRAAAECCSRRGFERFDGSRFQRRFFFDLPHYDTCSTRSDIFVVISWYSLPFFGK